MTDEFLRDIFCGISLVLTIIESSHYDDVRAA